MSGSQVSRTQQAQQIQGFQQESQAQETPQGEGHHNGHCYRHGKHSAGKAAPRRSPLKPRRPRMRRSTNLHGGGDEEQFDHDSHHDMDEDRQRDPAALVMEMSNSQNQAWQGGQQHFGGSGGRPDDKPHGKLQFKLASMLGAVDDLPQRLLKQRLPGAEEIFGRGAGAPSAGELAAALGALVLALARQAASARGRPMLTRAVLAADHAHSCRQELLQLSLTLSDVKRLLIAQRRPVWGDQPLPAGAPESVGDTLALLPLQLLNAARPRTAAQRRQAIDRKQLILRTRGL